MTQESKYKPSSAEPMTIYVTNSVLIYGALTALLVAMALNVVGIIMVYTEHNSLRAAEAALRDANTRAASCEISLIEVRARRDEIEKWLKLAADRGRNGTMQERHE